jgi:hypothetical protein
MDIQMNLLDEVLFSQSKQSKAKLDVSLELLNSSVIYQLKYLLSGNVNGGGGVTLVNI